MLIKFIGVPGEEHESISMYGHDFPLGEPVEVTDPTAVRKLCNHPHFAHKPEAPDPRGGLKAALEALPGEYTDPDFVVNGMRNHFGELFTDEDEARVRELVKAPEPTATEEQPAVTEETADGNTQPAGDAGTAQAQGSRRKRGA